MKSESLVTNIFKHEILTAQTYTEVWIELISTLERAKCRKK